MLEKGFKLVGTPQMKPRKITLYGPSQMIDSISSVNTIYTSLIDLRANLTKSIPLESLWSQKLSRSQDSVLWTAEIREYTQKEIELPVEIINIPKGRRLQIFPETMILSV